jgi:predicted O-methyltransferase YrrM
VLMVAVDKHYTLREGLHLKKTPVAYHEKLLPVQPDNRKEFTGNERQLYEAIFDTILNFSEIVPPESQLTLATSDQFSIAEMGSNPVMLQFLRLLVTIKQPLRILEIGTFVGVSAIALAMNLPHGGRVITLEKYPHFAEIARKNFEVNGFTDRISLLEGDAFEHLEALKQSESFDMVFLDGNKERYDEYFTSLASWVKPGGIFLVDDVFFHGDVLTGHPKTEKGQGVLRFLNLAKRDPTYFKIILPIGHGVMVMVKSAVQ